MSQATHVRNIVLWTVLFAKSFGVIPDAGCPERCRCTTSDNIVVFRVDCGGSDLNTFPENIPNSTRELLLNDNRIEYLESGFFEHLWLENLQISRNQLSRLPSGCFKSLTRLLTLDLSANRILALANDTFKGLTNLRTLHIESNKLAGSNAYGILVFQPLSSLTDLFIHLNCIMDSQGICDYPDEALSYAKSLKRLTMDGSKLGPGLSSLQLEGLYLTGSCTIEHLTSDTLKYVNTKSLKHFWISCPGIRTIQPGIMSLFPNLQDLNLPLDGTNSLCEPGIKNLTLGLENTKVTRLAIRNMCSVVAEYSVDIFKGLTNTSIQRLEWARNNVFAFSPSAFEYLPTTMKYLKFFERYIHNKIPTSVLLRLINLETLDLSGKEDTVGQQPITMQEMESDLSVVLINDKRFVFLPRNLKRIFARYVQFLKIPFYIFHRDVTFSQPNSLEFVDISNSMPIYGYTGVIYGLHQLRFLNISNCGMSILSKKFFSDMPNLLTLNASGNQIGQHLWDQSYAQLFDNQTQLKTLDLSRNMIQYLPNKIFWRNEKLNMLLLKNNSLEDILFSIGELKSLQLIDVSGNNLNALSYQNMIDLDEIAEDHSITIKLQGNPLHCKCENRGFIKWLAQTKVTVADLNIMTCLFHNGSVLRLDDLHMISYRLEYKCFTSIVVSGCVLLFLGLLLVLIFFAMLYYNQWRLRYLYYIVKAALNPYHPLDPRKIEFHYDAYFSYDEDFKLYGGKSLRTYMMGTVFPALEGQGLRVMYREEIPGDKEVRPAISDAVRHSRKVFILLTPGYNDDDRNIYEFNIASLEGAYTRRQLIVMLAFGDLTLDNLTAEMILYVRSTQVYRFHGEFAHQTFMDFLVDNIHTRMT